MKSLLMNAQADPTAAGRGYRRDAEPMSAEAHRDRSTGHDSKRGSKCDIAQVVAALLNT